MEKHGMCRSQAIKRVSLGAAAAALAGSGLLSAADSPPPAGPYVLPPLPYAFDALEPYLDAQTMQIHHDKHHAAYVSNLNSGIL